MMSSVTFPCATLVMFWFSLMGILFNGMVQGALTDPSMVNIGDEICYEGYVMDYKCIELGTLVDNPTLVSLQNPDVHSVHCIVEVPACLESPFEILTDPPAGEMNYTRAFRLDDAGHDTLVEILLENGNCTSCTGAAANASYPAVVRGIRAEIKGIVTNVSSVEGEPATIRLLTASRSNNATVICGVEQQDAVPTPPTAGKVAPPAPSPTAGYSAAPGKLYVGAWATLILAPLVHFL